MRILKKITRIFLVFMGCLLLLLLVFIGYVYHVRDAIPPHIVNPERQNAERIVVDSSLSILRQNWLRKNRFGVYEMMLSGDGFDRGVAFGKLGKELVEYQEEVFTDEIQRMIPSRNYLRFLRYIVGFMNRNLSDYVIPEYQEEIYGVSLSASEKYNWIGTNYSRQLNYHAAHDIGHALANMMLVGCTSFAAWDQFSADSQLIVGRNFDFYAGDEFARNKIIAFYKPEKGHRFMSVTWPGFTGVVSGMNDAGLAVTINANKSAIPFGAATPVSLVAREIVQYASNIAEALAIATKRKMFVSESFLIASAEDHRAVVIEKTPEKLDVYASGEPRILCTNHYQGSDLAQQDLNRQQMKNSASVYRYERLKELLQTDSVLTPTKTAAILRDRFGRHGANIGWANEKAVNQFIAHHSVIFKPEERLVWVSTSPWQEGEYICYDLNQVFRLLPTMLNGEIHDAALTIAADPFLGNPDYRTLERFLALKKAIKMHVHVDPIAIIQSNPAYYDSYRMAGDEYVFRHQTDSAVSMYQHALGLEIATQEERRKIEEKIKQINTRR